MSVSAVFDCMVFLQGAARSHGPARRCLELVDRGEIALFVSAAVLAEVNDVLTRPKTIRRFPTLVTEDVQQFLRAVQAKAATLTDIPEVFHYERDPKDEPYVNLALAAEARYLVSRDRDLLDLMKEDLPDGQDFRRRFPNLTILAPEGLLMLLEPRQGAAPPDALL